MIPQFNTQSLLRMWLLVSLFLVQKVVAQTYLENPKSFQIKHPEHTERTAFLKLRISSSSQLTSSLKAKGRGVKTML
jgi:hypothetical protein